MLRHTQFLIVIMIHDSFSTWSLLFKVFVSIGEKRGWFFHDSLVLVYQMLLMRLSLCVCI